MQVIHFDFNGPRTLVTTDEPLSKFCAEDIIQGKSYPLPTWDFHPKVIVDLGGHAGEFSVMARLRWPEAKVYCFEPNPDLAPYLDKNAEQYGFTVFHEAVGPIGCQMQLRESGYGSVANSLVNRPNQTGKGRTVTVVPIMEVMRLKPDVLKIDCEGIEWQLFQAMDANDVLAAGSVSMYYIEFHSCGDRRLIDGLLCYTHDLWHANIGHRDQGEVMYIRKHTVPRNSGK